MKIRYSLLYRSWIIKGEEIQRLFGVTHLPCESRKDAFQRLDLFWKDTEMDVAGVEVL